MLKHYLLLAALLPLAAASAQDIPKVCAKKMKRTVDIEGATTIHTKLKDTRFAFVWKTIKQGEETTSLLLETRHPSRDYDDSGALVLLEDGTRLEFETGPVWRGTMSYGSWEHSAFCELTDEQIEILASSPIKQFRLGPSFDVYPTPANSTLVQQQMAASI